MFSSDCRSLCVCVCLPEPSRITTATNLPHTLSKCSTLVSPATVHCRAGSQDATIPFDLIAKQDSSWWRNWTLAECESRHTCCNINWQLFSLLATSTAPSETHTHTLASLLLCLGSLPPIQTPVTYKWRPTRNCQLDRNSKFISPSFSALHPMKKHLCQAARDARRLSSPFHPPLMA